MTTCTVCGTEIFVVDEDEEEGTIWGHVEERATRPGRSICDDPTPKEEV